MNGKNYDQLEMEPRKTKAWQPGWNYILNTN